MRPIIIFSLLAIFTTVRGYADDASDVHEFTVAIKLLNDADVQKELDISDMQIKAINDETNTVFFVLQLKILGKTGNDQSKKDARKFVLQVRASVQKILDDRQLRRLKQIARQNRQLPQLPTNGLLYMTKDISSALKIDNVSKSEIAKIEAEVEKKIIELHEKHKNEMERLLEERDQKIKSLLSSEQKKQYDEYFGDPFFKVLESFIASRVWLSRDYTRTKALLKALEQK